MTEHVEVSGIKAEIQFFMEKCFQASFGYLAGLFAVLALSRVDYVSDLASAAHMPVRSLISVIVLLLNLFYFTVIGSCLFAVLKRGYFILALGAESVDAKWELFTRRDRQKSARPMHALAWNIDNYYMLPIFGVLFVVSVIAGVLGLTSGSA
jgi:hypothetical protein